MIKKNKRFVFVVDNFLPTEILQYLQNQAVQQNYTASATKDDDHYGFGVKVENSMLENDIILKKIYEDFNVPKEVKLSNAFMHMRYNSKVLPHVDKGHYSFLLYLKGEPLLNNGTGFLNPNSEIAVHAGFLENRAIFFNAGLTKHTDMQGFGESSPRYSLNIFFKYEK